MAGQLIQQPMGAQGQQVANAQQVCDYLLHVCKICSAKDTTPFATLFLSTARRPPAACCWSRETTFDTENVLLLTVRFVHPSSNNR